MVMSNEPIRIQKWLSQLGLTSRREAERMIQEGRVSVDGQVIVEMGHKVQPKVQSISIDGKVINQKEAPKVYWLFHKPDKTMTTRSDELGRETIFDTTKLAKVKFRVATVGRLDYRTEGMLLISNDGELVHRLTHPSFKVPRHYFAWINRRLTDDEVEQIRKGFRLKDGIYKGCEIRYANRQSKGSNVGYWYEISIKEGRNRIVRRIFESFEGCEVKRLMRYGFGDIIMPDTLEPGNYIQLDPDQIKSLKKMAQMK